jgi:hypothetical protein
LGERASRVDCGGVWIVETFADRELRGNVLEIFLCQTRYIMHFAVLPNPHCSYPPLQQPYVAASLGEPKFDEREFDEPKSMPPTYHRKSSPTANRLPKHPLRPPHGKQTLPTSAPASPRRPEPSQHPLRPPPAGAPSGCALTPRRMRVRTCWTGARCEARRRGVAYWQCLSAAMSLRGVD